MKCIVCSKKINDLEDENEVKVNNKHDFMCKECFIKN